MTPDTTLYCGVFCGDERNCIAGALPPEFTAPLVFDKAFVTPARNQAGLNLCLSWVQVQAAHIGGVKEQTWNFFKKILWREKSSFFLC